MIILAPLHGYTDFIFRNVYARHFNGIDMAVSPFISLTHADKINPRRAKDVLPSNNSQIAVIPQLLGNDAALFVSMCNYLYDWGYTEINWNLGCPVKNIANKKRGSGILPYPDLIDELLDKIIPELKQELSIKLRLGYYDDKEINAVIPVLNNYPLKNICIHPRIGIQMYEGEIHHYRLQQIIGLIKHDIIYNGDIIDLKTFSKVKADYPSISSYMIGRGIFYNPWLAEEIKTNMKIMKKRETLIAFFMDLYDELICYKSEVQSLNKIKDLWQLFALQFKNSDAIKSEISHKHSLKEIKELTLKIVESEAFSI